jgi:hypothetical protein
MHITWEKEQTYILLLFRKEKSGKELHIKIYRHIHKGTSKPHLDMVDFPISG